jgi:hypothetical protein
MSNFHLSSARAAVDYVKKNITMGASNKLSDMFGTLTVVKFCTNEMRDKVDQELASYADANYVNNYNEAEFHKRYLKANASWSKLYGCGNCGEQSALAFTFLENQQIFPLDWVCTENWSHAFVIINRAKGSDLSNYQTWGSAAVICDPWSDYAGYASKNRKYFNLRLKWLYSRVR